MIYPYGPNVHAGDGNGHGPNVHAGDGNGHGPNVEPNGMRAHVIAKPIEQSDWFVAAMAAEDRKREQKRQDWMDRLDADPILANAVAETRY